ncbi:MAG: hypothetical protein WEB37_02180 [Bacteroidota bacterium]
MTRIRPETERFATALELYANKKFRFREEIGILLDLARSAGKMQVFEDMIFFAKFLSKSYDLMKRIGPDGEGYDKVSGEFRSTMEKSTTLLKTLVKDAPDDVKQRFSGRFFHLDQESISAVMSLMKELAWVKNWMVDGKELP